MPSTTTSVFAAVTLTVSAALASGAGLERPAIDGELFKLTQAEAATHAALVFERADLDKSGALDGDEFAALSVVTAELAHLNGYVVVEGEGFSARAIALPIKPPSALPRGERLRIETVARNTFYALAGEDGVLAKSEFVDAETARFNDADRNNNGALHRAELTQYAIGQARLSADV